MRRVSSSTHLSLVGSLLKSLQMNGAPHPLDLDTLVPYIPTSTTYAASQLPENSEAALTERGSTYSTNYTLITIEEVEQKSGCPGIPPLSLVFVERRNE